MTEDQRSDFLARLDGINADFQREHHSILQRQRTVKSDLAQISETIKRVEMVLASVKAGHLNLSENTQRELRTCLNEQCGFKWFAKKLESDRASLRRSLIFRIAEALAMATGRRLADIELGGKSYDPKPDEVAVMYALEASGAEYETSTTRKYLSEIRKDARAAPDGFQRRPPAPPT